MATTVTSTTREKPHETIEGLAAAAASDDQAAVQRAGDHLLRKVFAALYSAGYPRWRVDAMANQLFSGMPYNPGRGGAGADPDREDMLVVPKHVLREAASAFVELGWVNPTQVATRLADTDKPGPVIIPPTVVKQAAAAFTVLGWTQSLARVQAILAT